MNDHVRFFEGFKLRYFIPSLCLFILMNVLIFNWLGLSKELIIALSMNVTFLLFSVFVIRNMIKEKVCQKQVFKKKYIFLFILLIGIKVATILTLPLIDFYDEIIFGIPDKEDLDTAGTAGADIISSLNLLIMF